MSDPKRGSSDGHKRHVQNRHRNEHNAKLQQLTETIQNYEQQGAEMLKDRNLALLGEREAQKAQKVAEKERDTAKAGFKKKDDTIARMKRNRPWWTLLGGAGVGAVYLFGLHTTVGKGCVEVIFDAWNYWT